MTFFKINGDDDDDETLAPTSFIFSNLETNLELTAYK